MATVGLHWLTCTGRDAERERVTSRLSFLFGKPDRVGAVNLYREAVGWANGAKVMWDNRGGGDHFCVMLPGAVWDGLTWAESVDLIKDLGVCEMKATRVDIALDYRRCGLLERVSAAGNADHFSGPVSWAEKLTKRRGGEVVEHVVSFGTRQSESFVRFYDKGLESGDAEQGELERFEVEFKGDKAKNAWVWISAQPTAEIMMGLAFAAMDFREGDSAHLDRRRRLSWWESMIAGVKLLKVRTERVATTIKDKVDWMARCVKPFLLAVAKVVGTSAGDVLDMMVPDRASRGVSDLVLREAVDMYDAVLRKCGFA